MSLRDQNNRRLFASRFFVAMLNYLQKFWGNKDLKAQIISDISYAPVFEEVDLAQLEQDEMLRQRIIENNKPILVKFLDILLESRNQSYNDLDSAVNVGDISKEAKPALQKAMDEIYSPVKIVAVNKFISHGYPLVASEAGMRPEFTPEVAVQALSCHPNFSQRVLASQKRAIDHRNNGQMDEAHDAYVDALAYHTVGLSLIDHTDNIAEQVFKSHFMSTLAMRFSQVVFASRVAQNLVEPDARLPYASQVSSSSLFARSIIDLRPSPSGGILKENSIEEYLGFHLSH